MPVCTLCVWHRAVWPRNWFCCTQLKCRLAGLFALCRCAVAESVVGCCAGVLCAGLVVVQVSDAMLVKGVVTYFQVLVCILAVSALHNKIVLYDSCSKAVAVATLINHVKNAYIDHYIHTHIQPQPQPINSMADEAGFLELLVANERIGRWLDILCDPYQRTKCVHAMFKLQHVQQQQQHPGGSSCSSSTRGRQQRQWAITKAAKQIAGCLCLQASACYPAAAPGSAARCILR